jgi:hypothetical protein
MRSELAAAIPKRRAVDTSMRVEVANVFTLDAHFSLSLPAIVTGLAGAAAIVYLAKRHPQPALPKAADPDAIETTGVSLVK